MANAEELVNDYESHIQKVWWTVNKEGKTVGIDDNIPRNLPVQYHEPNTPCATDIITVPSSQCTASRHSEELNLVGEVDGSDAGQNVGPVSVPSSFRKLIGDISESMDKALLEKNKKYIQDHPSEAGPIVSYPRHCVEHKFNDPRVRDSYLKRRKLEIKASRREDRPYKNPPVLLDPPSDDETDVNLLQKVMENWNDNERASEIDSYETEGEESDDSFRTNES
ncbi:uncharacterized protein EV420DRAFT_1639541 [Desarmillaria tabescens]|uniref:Uncharacterized protein n=1 Tax=Armillaria tabescens TaxID=1929756 RepID=A0AA39TKI9_ARMTA|nr:uncharacterized protein EV420DRAFT_1639541 [Desarmillaria tabescens]KAK0462327.1 hypothetical protein EV420DRAFT_1639541 [Desarmillaria tabescens]